MLLDTYALSIAGHRTNNEDAICAQPEIGLFVVADTIHSLVRRTAGDGDVTWPYAIDPQRSLAENEVIIATRMAADQIAVRRRGELRDMGSTVVVLRLTGEHAGDLGVARAGGSLPVGRRAPLRLIAG